MSKWFVGGMVLVLAASALAQPSPPAADGTLPIGDDAKPLNFDFESGDLSGWTAEGEAFQGQPIQGDTVSPRRGDMRSNHAGQYWIGTFEVAGDKPRGTLTSRPFHLNHPWASFLIGGGSGDDTYVELVWTANGATIYRFSGSNDETMRRIAVDLQQHRNKQVIIRIVDNASGGWGHINFDDHRTSSRIRCLTRDWSRIRRRRR
jgi:hypothetical protein